MSDKKSKTQPKPTPHSVESLTEQASAVYARKLSAFTTALGQVLYHEHPVGIAVVLTDKEIIAWVNDMLPDEDRVSEELFESWKHQDNTDPMGKRFRELYGKVLRMQKLAIMQLMAEDLPGAWQKWAWMMERRFDEWNLRNRVVDETPAPKQLVFKVKAD